MSVKCNSKHNKNVKFLVRSSFFSQPWKHMHRHTHVICNWVESFWSCLIVLDGRMNQLEMDWLGFYTWFVFDSLFRFIKSDAQNWLFQIIFKRNLLSYKLQLNLKRPPLNCPTCRNHLKIQYALSLLQFFFYSNVKINGNKPNGTRCICDDKLLPSRHHFPLLLSLLPRLYVLNISTSLEIN